MTRLLAGLALCLPLPFLAAALRDSARRQDRPPIVASGGALAAGRDPSSRPALPPVRSVVEAHLPDRQPEVTPPVAKAGPVRQVAPPAPRDGGAS